MDSFELIINLTIIGLLIPTIVFAYRLNRNLNILRQNQKSLSQLVQSLNEATFKAENSIPKLKSVTEHSSEGLKEIVDNAKTLKDDLTFINERADNLADRLEIMIKDGRTIKDEKNTGERFGNTKSAMPFRKDKESETFGVSDSRSEAEMELLKALRSIK